MVVDGDGFLELVNCEGDRGFNICLNLASSIALECILLARIVRVQDLTWWSCWPISGEIEQHGGVRMPGGY
jgi:hypothetical protein